MQRARNLFAQNKIAIIWDFDKTLIPYDMQRPLFEHFGVDEATFWREANELPAYYRARGNELVSEQLYLVHMLSYVKAGRFKGLNNDLLRQLGADLTFYANGVVDTEWEALRAFRGVSEGDMVRYAIRKREPLLVEHELFRDAVLGLEADIVDLRQGLATVEVSEQMLLSAETGSTVELADAATAGI